MKFLYEFLFFLFIVLRKITNAFFIAVIHENYINNLFCYLCIIIVKNNIRNKVNVCIFAVFPREWRQKEKYSSYKLAKKILIVEINLDLWSWDLLCFASNTTVFYSSTTSFLNTFHYFKLQINKCHFLSFKLILVFLFWPLKKPFFSMLWWSDFREVKL